MSEPEGQYNYLDEPTETIFLKTINIYIILLLLDRPPCPDGMRIIGRWCFTPCEEAKETLGVC